MSAMHGTMMIKNHVKSKCGESSHTKKQKQMLYMDPLPSHHLEVFEKTVASHNNINHRQAKYHVGPHDGVLVKPFRTVISQYLPLSGNIFAKKVEPISLPVT